MSSRRSGQQQERKSDRSEKWVRIEEITARLEELSIERNSLKKELYKLVKDRSNRSFTGLYDRCQGEIHIGDIVYVITESSETVRFHGVRKAKVIGTTSDDRRVLLSCCKDATKKSNREPHNIRPWSEIDQRREDARESRTSSDYW